MFTKDSSVYTVWLHVEIKKETISTIQQLQLSWDVYENCFECWKNLI